MVYRFGPHRWEHHLPSFLRVLRVSVVTNAFSNQAPTSGNRIPLHTAPIIDICKGYSIDSTDRYILWLSGYGLFPPTRHGAQTGLLVPAGIRVRLFWPHVGD